MSIEHLNNRNPVCFGKRPKDGYPLCAICTCEPVCATASEAGNKAAKFKAGDSVIGTRGTNCLRRMKVEEVRELNGGTLRGLTVTVRHISA